MQTAALHQLFLKSSGVGTDTRKIASESIFFALRGDRFNANEFAAEALSKGASYVVIDDERFHSGERTILVKDSLVALQELAAFHRNYLGIPIIGLTGSNGKTTTKELINAVLSRKFKTGFTFGNLNNHIGVPLTLLSFSDATEIGIVEMGANHQKEIELLCSIASPDFGYITNFGKAHLEGFGGVEGVIKGKSELYDYLRANGKKAFVNADDALQVEKSSGIETFTFGSGDVNVSISGVSADPFVRIDLPSLSVQSNLIGLYNANNIGAAIAIGRYFEVPDADIKTAIESYIPNNNRSQLINRNGSEIILDAYNANPSSMQAAIANFLQLEKPSKVLVLGDMFELGDESADEHHEIVKTLIGADAEVYFVGKDFYASKSGESSHHFYPDYESLATSGMVAGFAGKTLLIKGSRGMALERLLELL